MSFTSTVAGKAEGPFPNFTEAFQNFWPRLISFVEEGASEMALGFCWIAKVEGSKEIPLLWDGVNNLGLKLGLVAKGKLIIPIPEVDEAEEISSPSAM
jgi:hypothetical protein